MRPRPPGCTWTLSEDRDASGLGRLRYRGLEGWSVASPHCPKVESLSRRWVTATLCQLVLLIVF